jgi:hypothetical protein
MDRKQLATIAMVCGVVAFVAVLLPWYSVSVDLGGMPAELREMVGQAASSKSLNGTEGDFNGTFVIVLSLLGAAAAALVVLGKTHVLPLDERQHLFAALGLFALAVVVTLTDVFRDLGGASQSGGGMKVEAGKAFGLYLTLIATLAGAAAAFLAVRMSATKPPAAPSTSADE